ncbi:TPA: hypothetical protein DDW69_02925 [candidate division CPR2 bacterium]|uniref:Uncharacterized protein n=1 Tax=candidate division CPR2 bacterium GW2011_GWC1_41_48 TaxID=1618344 RepID=A0A0G0Z817_UNCC2|nr:MAG: hypothetical protein UT47_C0003G0219 [candidate division CPR2 bacterium GW2011_GWC2_39_35]KKR27129.1 MAG: hypothetical protein UT59_C0068G0004 [candidate division CPR2 bacterium GW2011_GWD1_39_7]KKR29198.1 MAG: hypothetical protein UT60_C0005G0003 [candidate division CPR2 bacterium GW2011_GWD2_39_7]KKS09158.1 MAG: hypothetical protein UU65_C0003G0213 [candidate division CPR2 bacterium GW2011_GWC1_41_48]OGB70755.1 MAG: hypothetical protein A2Y26_02650 [candidate division CPR2 bacterium G
MKSDLSPSKAPNFNEDEPCPRYEKCKSGLEEASKIVYDTCRILKTDNAQVAYKSLVKERRQDVRRLLQVENIDDCCNCPEAIISLKSHLANIICIPIVCI